MDIVERLIELVGIPSVSGSEARISDHIEAMVAGARPGWPRRRIGNNLVVGPVPAATGAAGRPLIALVGHVDTVPPQGNETPELRDGQVHGIGSVDMKAGVAVMCDLLESLPADRLQADLLFVFYDKEEAGFDENGLGFVIPEMPVVSEVDFAFVLEPTALALEVGCNGHLNAEITFHGRSAHSARPWLGDNAIQRAGEFISRIGSIPVQEVRVGDALYRQTVSITTAEGGIARNVVPDAFRLNLNHRFPPGQTIEEASARIAALVPDGAECRIIDAAPPGAVPTGNPVYERFRRRFGLPINGKQGWTDVARLSSHGIDAVNFGPGAPELCHRRDEHVPVDQLTRCRDILRDFLLDPGA